MSLNIETAKTSKRLEGFIPNPKLKLPDQVSEVMRFKHYSSGYSVVAPSAVFLHICVNLPYLR